MRFIPWNVTKLGRKKPACSFSSLKRNGRGRAIFLYTFRLVPLRVHSRHAREKAVAQSRAAAESLQYWRRFRNGEARSVTTVSRDISRNPSKLAGYFASAEKESSRSFPPSMITAGVKSISKCIVPDQRSISSKGA